MKWRISCAKVHKAKWNAMGERTYKERFKSAQTAAPGALSPSPWPVYLRNGLINWRTTSYSVSLVATKPS